MRATSLSGLTRSDDASFATRAMRAILPCEDLGKNYMDHKLALLYEHAPPALQHAMVTLAGYRNAKTRYGAEYWAYRAWLDTFDGLPYEDKLAYQQAELEKFVKHAVQHSPFYRRLFENIDTTKIREIADLRILPPVDKELLRMNIEDVVTVSRSDAVLANTGGTTGKSLTVRMTTSDSMKRMAMLDHFKHRLGFEHRKMRRATFSGKPIVPFRGSESSYWRYNMACKQMLYSTFHLTEENLECYVQSLNRFKPKALDGFFSSICTIANFIERHNLDVTFEPVAVFPTSETVTETGRQLIERVFNTKVYDQYASSEGAPFVTECVQGRLHVELSSGVIERRSSQNDEILVTSFHTHGTPLIRYAIGDSMEFGEVSRCECGITSPIIEKILGRKSDFIYGANGARVNAANIANAFKYAPNSVIRAQVVQLRKNEIRVLLETDQNLYDAAAEAVIRRELSSKLGNEMAVLFEYVDTIPQESSGKYRLVKNMLD